MTPVEFNKMELANLMMLVHRQVLEIQLENLEHGESDGRNKQLDIFQGIESKLHEAYEQERKQYDAR